MNYFPPMSHYHMPEKAPIFPPPSNFPPPPGFPTNRFIYVKHNFVNPNPVPAPKVLVNPHFKKKVFVNPQFKPKIHINPNVLKNFVNVPKVESKPETTVISTRNKLVRIPLNSTEETVRKRRNSLHTKYKIVRSSGAKTSSVNKYKIGAKNPVNKYKFDKRDCVKSAKKRYVYVNRFLSIDVVAKNVLLKSSNLCKPGFVNINGILYKKSPNSLKKASDSFKSRKIPLKSPSKYKLVRKEGRTLVKRYKLIRSKTTTPTKNKLRKCNIPCLTYRKYGKCPRNAAGMCFKLHNPDQIVLCTRFLQGACRDEKCLLSHKVSHEKMPTCKYFLEGMCSKDGCPYLHVRISPKAEICRDFLEGFCKKGARCDKRHQFLCPDFEKSKQCPKRRCPYPHGNTVRKSKVINTLAKKCSMKKKETESVTKIIKNVIENNRYYKEKTESGEEPVIKTVSRERPKLGDLPAFIPFFDAT